MAKYALIFYFLFTSFLVFAQPGGPHEIPASFHFKFYSKKGEVVTPESKRYSVKLNYPPPFEFGNLKFDSNPTQFTDGFYRCLSFSGATVDILFSSGKDTMKIKTSASLDSIPFIKGNYLIPSEYAPFYEITFHKGARINKIDWNTFKVRNFKETVFPDTLRKTDCQFWKDYKAKIPLDFTPRIFGLVYNQNFPPKIYGWDWEHLYVSTDKGKNWENILTVDEPYEMPIVAFKDKNTLLLFKIKKYQKPINKKPEVYFSKDGGLSWQLDSTYTRMGIYFAAFNNKEDGFAYAIKYFADKKLTKTVFYVTKDGGKNWVETSTNNERFLPISVDFWNENTIVVNDNDGTLKSFDGGKTWNFYSKVFEYYNAFRNYYPSLISDEFIHVLEKYDSTKKVTSKVLTINYDYYVEMTATENVWCVSGQEFTLISKDQGKTWNYYYGGVAGSSIFKIIDDQYIFNGETLFEVTQNSN